MIQQKMNDILSSKEMI